MTGEILAGRYELAELLGVGGMSRVYKAHDRLLERDVALKILHAHFVDDAEYVERFRREARAAAQLSHPHVVTVIDRGEDGGRQFIVFEHVAGENLKELVERSGPLPVRRALELGVEVAEALAFAHEHGLIHRDVKPQNVLVTPDGEAKVTDFGIVRSLEVEHGVTLTGTVLGTSNYLSPEQASGEQVTPATDVYSLGVVLYELLTGELPFPGGSFVAVALKHVSEQPPDLLERRPELPLRLVAAVDRALEKDPARRFATMDAFALELRRCLEELDSPSEAERTIVSRVGPPPPGRPYRLNGGRRRRRAIGWGRRVPVLAVGGGAAVAAAVAGVLVGLDHAHGAHSSGSRGGGGGGASPVALHGVGASDPAGDGEHDAEAPRATDGDPATYWETQHYFDGGGSLGKPGVGVVLDAGQPVALGRMTVQTDTPGYTASILAGDSEQGPFTADSPSQSVGSTTTFVLRGRTARYYVVWITNLGAHESVHVNEVRATR